MKKKKNQLFDLGAEPPPQPKPIPQTVPYSMTTKLQALDWRPDNVRGKALPSSVPRPSQWTNPAAADANGPTLDPGFLTIAPELFEPTIGVYLMLAPTGSGKTILSLALTAWSNANGVPASYISCFEPRTSPYLKGNTNVFASADKFWSDLVKVIPKVGKKLVIIDSATLPLEAYSKNFPYQPTYAGGMQPSARGFCEMGNNIAIDRTTVLVLIINTSMVPYAQQLTGSVEGYINVADVGAFAYADRSESTGRTLTNITVPVQFVNPALQRFGYGVYSPRISRSFTRQYVGI
jgi:hypothetical protein